MKCDFCDKPAIEYGYQHCYFACEEHLEQGQAVQANLIAEMAAGEGEYYRLLREVLQEEDDNAGDETEEHY